MAQIASKAPPGTYRFYCAILRHAALGMHGTFTVRSSGGKDNSRRALSVTPVER